MQMGKGRRPKKTKDRRKRYRGGRRAFPLKRKEDQLIKFPPKERTTDDLRIPQVQKKGVPSCLSRSQKVSAKKNADHKSILAAGPTIEKSETGRISERKEIRFFTNGKKKKESIEKKVHHFLPRNKKQA